MHMSCKTHARYGVISLGRRGFGQIALMRSGRYQARYVHPEVSYKENGRPNLISAPSTFATKGDAQTWLAGVQTDIARGVWKSPEQIKADKVTATITARRDALTFGEYATGWLETLNIRETTRRGYDLTLRNYLMPYWETTPLKAITTADVRTWLAEVAPGRPVARERAYMRMRTILDAAVDDDLLEVSPIKKQMLAKVKAAPATEESPALVTHKRRALTGEQLNRLADEVPDYMRLPVLLAGTTGLRIGELRALRGAALDVLPNGTAWLSITAGTTGEGKYEVTGKPKTDQSIRLVPVPPSLKDDLVALAGKVGPKGLLFPSSTDPKKVLPYSTFLNNIKRAGQRADLGHVTPHSLRRTAVSIAAAAGYGATEIRDLVGHTTTRMTDYYADSYDDRLAALVATNDRERTDPQAPNVVPLKGKRTA